MTSLLTMCIGGLLIVLLGYCGDFESRKGLIVIGCVIVLFSLVFGAVALVIKSAFIGGY